MCARVVRPVADQTAARAQQRGKQREHRGLAGTVRTEQAEDAVTGGVKGDLGECAAAAEMARDGCDREVVELNHPSTPLGMTLSLGRPSTSLGATLSMPKGRRVTQ